jgi:2-polyprenyl-3-methyl-5-hydroxy-6-metoxy-1,4-benzoquinol methylase
VSDVTIEDDGERMIPEKHGDSIMYAEHMTRYIAASQLVAGKTVLDIACGTGYGSWILAQSASQVSGIDNSPEAIAYASEHYAAENISYSIGQAEQIDLPDASVDVVVSFETIEHIAHYDTFLSEIRRVLRPDGLAIISTPNDLEFAKGNHHHVHQFAEAELREVLAAEFEHIEPYYQATWAYAQVSDAAAITKPGNQKITVYSFSPLKPEQYLYFYMLCSNRPITEKLAPIGGLGGHYSARELEESRLRLLTDTQDLYEQRLEEEREKHRRTKIKLRQKEHELHAITTSSSYKLARGMAAGKRVARRGINGAKTLNPKRVHLLATNKRMVHTAYNSPKFTAAFEAPATAETAVIIHLYYTEMIEFFAEKLQALGDTLRDVYITIPAGKEAAIEAIHALLPDARVAVVPNCGRDVLPFVQVMKNIANKGYVKILKLHSKKSPHRQDGEQWRDKIIDSLLPGDAAEMERIMRQLDDPKTALLGPMGEYVSMLVNISATEHHVRKLMGKLFDKTTAEEFVQVADEYGFFAGTMFWARCDALLPVVSAVDAADFEPELGQEDSTLAHALERLLNVIPELQGREMYEIQPGEVHKIPYQTTNIPKWSEVAIDDD